MFSWVGWQIRWAVTIFLTHSAVLRFLPVFQRHCQKVGAVWGEPRVLTSMRWNITLTSTFHDSSEFALSRPSLKAGAVPLHYFQCKWELFNCWLCVPGHGEHQLTGVCLRVTSRSTMASLQWSFIHKLSWLWQGEFSGFLWFIASELYLFIHKIPKWSQRNASFLPLSPPRGLCAKKRLGIGWQVISWFAVIPDLLSYQSPPQWELFLLEWQQSYSFCGLFFFSSVLQV